MIVALITDLLPLILSIFLASLLSIFFHEMGHAIPVLFMSKGKVSIYVGSFGNKGASLKIAIGRLDMYFKYNPFLWTRGICKSKK